MNFMQAMKETLKKVAGSGTPSAADSIPRKEDLLLADGEKKNDSGLSERGQKLMRVLKSQDELLNSILKEQGRLHKDVKNRKWESMQKSIANLRRLSDSFVELDQQREELAGDDRQLYYQPGIEPLFVSLRTKLSKSKIENEVLQNYVGATRDFIGNIIEECYVKQSGRYGADGSMVRSEYGSMLVNTEL